ncbi:MAG: YfaZ family outer membrane protein [Pseudomonadota bacterium]
MTRLRIRSAGSLVLTLALALTATGHAAELDLNLNDDAARLSFASDITARNLRFDLGWLHHQDRGDVVNVGLHLTGEASPGANPVIGGLGGKIFVIDPDALNVDAVVLGIGGYLRYTMPQYDRINVYAHAYIAPDVLSFGDGDRFHEVEARIGYNVLREADVYIGLRNISANFDNGAELTVDTGLIAGIQLRF